MATGLTGDARRAWEQSFRYARELREEHDRLLRAALQSLQALANALDARDAYTRGHSGRVSATAHRLALALGLSAPIARTIAEAGLLHDIGKIGVPDAALRHPGKLTGEMLESMRRHPTLGAEIVAPLADFAEGARIIRYHHERIDGSGYPDGLAGEAIPIGARVVAVADVFDALTTNRSYRRALSPAEALRLLDEEADRTLDGHIVRVFKTLQESDARPL